jgi:hypothetical protein
MLFLPIKLKDEIAALQLVGHGASLRVTIF